MTTFLPTLLAVFALLLTAVPGYLLIKTKLLSEDSIPAMTKILLFVCHPCLVITTFQKLTYDLSLLLDLLIAAGIILLVHGVMLGGAYLVLRKRCADPLYRVLTIATTLANCAFFGIPIIEALYGDAASELLIYTSIYGVVMNILGWTVVSAIIANDIKFMKAKKILFNPATLGAVVALALYLLQIPLFESFPTLGSMIEILGRAASPISMIVMGMRLATVERPISLLTNPKVYLAIAVKSFVMPLVGFGILLLLPIDPIVKQVLYILFACPVAAIVQSFSEMIGAGQREGANLVLLGTALSIVTLPLMSLLIPFLK